MVRKEQWRPSPRSPLNVFVGWDSREDIAWQVCRHSLQRRTHGSVNITPLKQQELRAKGIYTRERDPLASTEFTYTRFLIPYLMDYQGWALFCDCDVLWRADVQDLFALADERCALMCVHHDHRPREETKMDGRTQTLYPRKNWSSLVLYNCGHAANRILTPDLVNSQTGAFLHRFQWLQDEQIGSLPETWNWLEGWSRMPESGPPKVIHYTRGGPWFPNWQNVQFADLWIAERGLLGQ
ncbi:MAG: glycosyltransferase [Gammaproteobacteria bacterium]|nr:glycosyltransferase [Gammaproteobacteria bacterium]